MKRQETERENEGSRRGAGAAVRDLSGRTPTLNPDPAVIPRCPVVTGEFFSPSGLGAHTTFSPGEVIVY